MSMKRVSEEFLFGKKIEVEDLGDGVSRQILGYDESIMMVKVMFEKGAIGYAHHHKHAQTTYVESGKFEVKMGDEVKILTAGDAFFAPSDKIHGVKCEEKGALIDVFSPIRDDFFSEK
ncbi:cupin domain-containing protein [Puteibacter caeruleilacunae]|nr:cupin domain-containing protein [Puteibacter caeruleilacunae]